MVNTVLASLALFATSVSALGSAVVVNQCPYQVFLFGVPAAGGGFEQTEKTLQTGDSWTQQWTELSNKSGWSIKLAKDTSLSNIMQYEYTYQTVTPDIIWFDLSDVNGNPWTGDWEIVSDGHSCSPKEQAYRYATDDAYGMQSCNSAATITVTLCSGSSSGSSSGSNPPPSSSAAPAPPATTVSVPAFSAPASSVSVAVDAPIVVTLTTYAGPVWSLPPVSSSTPSPAPSSAPASTPSPVPAPAPATSAAPATPWTGPWTHWGLGDNGAVIADAEGLVARSLTTFATSVSFAPTATDAADHVVRRHDHGIHRHRHHHNA